jgi:hypothetical protein
MAHLSPDTLFVIACPVCRGHVAATGNLCGRDACCPLCANLFHVPNIDVPTPATVTAPPQPAVAEDWGRVIDKLAPPAAKTESLPSAHETPSDFLLVPQVPTEAASDPSLEPAATILPDGSPPLLEPQLVEATPAAVLPASVPEPSTAWIDTVLESADSPTDTEAAAPSAAIGEPGGFSHFGSPLLPPDDNDLVLREPIRTIRQGDTVIEIRRLTPEERKARRFRRNLMMIVIGISILMAIVIIFGVPQKPPR